MESARMLFICLFAFLFSSLSQAQVEEDLKYIQFQDEKTIVLNNGFLIHKDSYEFYQGKLKEFFPDLRSHKETKKKQKIAKTKILQDVPFAYYDIRFGESQVELVKHDLVDDTEVILKTFSSTTCEPDGCVLGTLMGVTFDREMNVYYGVTTGTTENFTTIIYRNDEALFQIPNGYFFRSAEVGTYQVKIKAKQTGPFFFEGRLGDQMGEVNGAYRIKGNLAEGEEKNYEVSFNPMRDELIIFEENLTPLLELTSIKALGLTLGNKTHLLATFHIDPTEVNQYPESISEFVVKLDDVEANLERWKNSQLYVSKNNQRIKRSWLKKNGDIVIEAHIPKLTSNFHSIEFEIVIQGKTFKGILKLRKKGLVYVLE